MILSVIIPAYGREELLIRCLASLNRNTQGDCDYEVCVVDDGSAINEKAVRRHAAPEYPLLWHSLSSDIGRGGARNEGIRSTTGEIIVFLDSDMEAYENLINSHIACHRNHPGTAVIGRVIWPKRGSFLRYIGSRGPCRSRRSMASRPR